MTVGGMSDVVSIKHDPLCPVCEAGHGADCSCTCFCDFIMDVREDERRALAPYLPRWVQGS